MDSFCNGRLSVAVGDITEIAVDAIVNAANSGLMGGGGVDGAIHRKGGHLILEECRRIRTERYPEGMPAGNAVITTAGMLPSKQVIHTVGPVWSDGKHGEPELLAKAYRSSLELAEENGVETLAFPAISTGIYGYPKEEAARTAYTVIRDHLGSHALPKIITLVFFSPEDRSIFVETAKGLE